MDFTLKEYAAFYNRQKELYDVVRLVDVSLTEQYSLAEDGGLIKEPYKCYAFWHKGERCRNCISSLALRYGERRYKFEFVENDVYFVIANPVTVDGTKYVLELVARLDGETLMEGYGESDLIKSIEAHNRELFTDELTGAYNRRYLTERVMDSDNVTAVAMMDLDDFKSVNDTYGHTVGDHVLVDAVKAMLSGVRESDAVIRYGGDEFLIVFYGIPRSALTDRLNNIVSLCSASSEERHPEVKVSVSIGAVYCADRAQRFIDDADKALYQAKKTKGCVVIEER